MVGWARRRGGPQELSFVVGDGDVVDAGLAPAHQAGGIELPLLVAVRAKPVARVVAPLVLKAHRDPVVVERPQLLDQAVLDLARPLSPQKGDDLGAALEELRAVAPAAVLGVRARDPLGVARIPGGLGHPDLLYGGLEREW